MEGNYGNLNARNKEEILSTKWGLPHVFHINQFSGHIEESDVGLTEDELAGKGVDGLNLSMPKAISTLGDGKKGPTWTRLQKPRCDHTDSLGVVIGQKRCKPTTFYDLESQSKKKIVI